MVNRNSRFYYCVGYYCLFQTLVLFTGCSTFRTAPTSKDVKNLKSATSIESKQEQIVQHTEAIKVLALETKQASVKIQNRSDGEFHIPKWIWWVIIIGGLAYLGLLPVIAGVGIRVIHKVAKGIKQVEY